MINSTLSSDLVEAIDALTENLLASEPFTAFNQAYVRFQADHQARGLMRSLEESQDNLRRRQANGGLSQDDIVQFRSLQMEVQANQLIGSYIQAQNNALSYLQDVNQQIGQQLGVDFATLARRPSNCCG